MNPFKDYPPEFAKYAATYGNNLERIGATRWDTVQFTSAAINQLVLFTVMRATIDLSNMKQPGMIESPNGFLVRAINFYVKQLPRSEARAAAGNVQPGAIDNIQQLINDGVLELFVGDKMYVQVPLWMVPSGGGAWGMEASDGDVADPGEIQDQATVGIPDARNAYTLDVPVFIQPQQVFRVQLFWPAAITLAGGNTNITVALDGDMVRPVQ